MTQDPESAKGAYLSTTERAAASQMVDKTPRPATPDLRCPVCWDPITARLAYTGTRFSEHRDLDGYECDNFRCGAEWDSSGRNTVPSRLTATVQARTDTKGPRRTRAECLTAADAIEGALHLLDDEDSAQTLARLADQWRAEAVANR